MILQTRPTTRLAGTLTPPGDKSISHRALLLAALAAGRTSISGLQEGEDCRATAGALEALGLRLEREPGLVHVSGEGPGGLRAPAETIDCGNSGTTMRLLAGVLAGRPFRSCLAGDRSLNNRPMDRVIAPLSLMGARLAGGDRGRPPLVINGGSLRGIEYRLPVASAQVKSAVLLAGVQARGVTTVIEPLATRDHTERMLALFGAPPAVAGNRIAVTGPARLVGRPVTVPGDFSAAAFFLAAAAIVPGSDILVRAVGLNPTRTAFLEVLRRMGAAVTVEKIAGEDGEPCGDVRVRGRRALEGISLSGALIPNLIDEIPLVAVLGLFATGTTEVSEAAELRVKESDRIAVMVGQLRNIGARIEEKPDGFAIVGPQRPRGGRVSAHGDHRVAMALAVAGLASREGVDIEGGECAAVSHPGFAAQLASLAAAGGA